MQSRNVSSTAAAADDDDATDVDEDDDFVHAKRNENDVPQNSGRPRTRKASHNVVCQQ